MSNSANLLINISDELIASIEVICSYNHLPKESLIEEAIWSYITKLLYNQNGYSLAQMIQGYLEMGTINIKIAQEYC